MKNVFAVVLSLLLLISVSNAKDEVSVKKITDKSASFIIKTDTKRTILVLHSANETPLNPNEVKESSLMQETVDINEIKPIKNKYYVVFDGAQSLIPITIKGLLPKNKYTLSIYKSKDKDYDISQHNFSTLAEEPTKQASGIAFRQPTETNMELVWVNGNGENRIVVASKGKSIAQLPQDGKWVPANPKFGAPESKIGENAYVVYAGPKNECKVENLEPATIYSFQVFEYNGSSESVNYITTNLSGNPRWKMTAIPTPKMLPAKNIHEIGCVLAWEGSPNVLKYILDIAYDEKFTRFAELYENADVGDITEIEVLDLDPNEDWYVRVRALGDGSQSDYSKPLVIKKGDRKK